MTFEEFLNTELEGLNRYARLSCGDRHSAHDLTADTLVDAPERWDKIGDLEMPVPYVRRMLTNRHIDRLRRRRLTLRIMVIRRILAE